MEVLVDSSTKIVTFSSFRHARNIFGQVRGLTDTHILPRASQLSAGRPQFLCKERLHSGLW